MVKDEKAFYFNQFLYFLFSIFTGKYYDLHGGTLILNADHSFFYKYQSDLYSSWNVGHWKFISNKVIHLEIEEIHDVVVTENGLQEVLSSDTISSKVPYAEYAITSISGGGQSRKTPPLRLKFRNKKLFYTTEYEPLKSSKRYFRKQKSN